MKPSSPANEARAFSGHPSQPGELAWARRASADILEFFKRYPLVANDPHAEVVLMQCASLLWERRLGSPTWSFLSIREVFRRLAIEQQFFADPALVLAHYEVLHAFVAWLSETQKISSYTADRLLDELMAARTPMVEEARSTLRARRESLKRQGAWHEVLRTIKT